MIYSGHHPQYDNPLCMVWQQLNKQPAHRFQFSLINLAANRSRQPVAASNLFTIVCPAARRALDRMIRCSMRVRFQVPRRLLPPTREPSRTVQSGQVLGSQAQVPAAKVSETLSLDTLRLKRKNEFVKPPGLIRLPSPKATVAIQHPLINCSVYFIILVTFLPDNRQTHRILVQPMTRKRRKNHTIYQTNHPRGKRVP